LQTLRLRKEPILFKLNSALYKYEQAGENSSAFLFQSR
jgi:hypothetical protein